MDIIVRPAQMLKSVAEAVVQSPKTVMKVIRVLFGSDDANDFPFAVSEVSKLQKFTRGMNPVMLDDQTWDDLGVTQYLTKLSSGVSIFGRQMLYKRLRDGVQDSPNQRALHLMHDSRHMDRVSQTCEPLRYAQVEISELLFGPSTIADPIWANWLWVIPAILALSGWLTTISTYGWIGVVASLGMLFYFQIEFFTRIQVWNGSTVSLKAMLWVYAKLGVLAKSSGDPALVPFLDAPQRSGKIAKLLAAPGISSALSMLGAYTDWFLLQNVRHYFKGRRVVRSNIEFLRHCHLAVAELEADIALARHLQITPFYCWPKRSVGLQVSLDRVVHPLLDQAIPFSITLEDKGAFISGQNGIGKSTLLRTLGLNLIVARGLGFCYAHEASLPICPVYSSIQNEDSLDDGESLYNSELRRAKELLNTAEQGCGSIYLIDEIFRGTNFLEAVSVSAAVLHSLMDHGLVIVSSHNLMLAPLLSDRFDPYCVTAPDNHPEELALVPGILKRPNGIALLAKHEFGARIEGKAKRVFDWLSENVVHPNEKANLFEMEGDDGGTQNPVESKASDDMRLVRCHEQVG